jgi:phage terminase small subunit
VSINNLKLSAMMEAYCQHLFSGNTQIEAYRLAGYSENQLPDTIYSNASRLSADSRIIARLSELRETVTEANVLTKERAITEALINLSMARDLEQIGPANQSLKLAAEFSGITQSIQSSAQLVTQVTVVLNRGTDTDSVAIEAQSLSLSEADSSLDIEAVEE